MNIELLQQLCEASAVSGDEQEVRNILINTLESCVNEITFDGLGSFVARKGNKGPKVAVVGHMDEVGFMVTHIDESGFLRFTTIGGWWNQSMLNHRVTIRTHKGFKIPGVIGSVAPHALTESKSNNRCHLMRCSLILARTVAKKRKSAALKLAILLARKPILPAGAKIK